MSAKQVLWVRVGHRSVTESDGVMGPNDTERRHRYSHPDVHIRILSDKQVRIAGSKKSEMLRNGIMQLLQHYGYSVAALRYHPAERAARRPDGPPKRGGPRQMKLL